MKSTKTFHALQKELEYSMKPVNEYFKEKSDCRLLEIVPYGDGFTAVAEPSSGKGKQFFFFREGEKKPYKRLLDWTIDVVNSSEEYLAERSVMDSKLWDIIESRNKCLLSAWLQQQLPRPNIDVDKLDFSKLKSDISEIDEVIA